MFEYCSGTYIGDLMYTGSYIYKVVKFPFVPLRAKNVLSVHCLVCNPVFVTTQLACYEQCKNTCFFKYLVT